MTRYVKVHIVEVVFCPEKKDYEFLEICSRCPRHFGDTNTEVECERDGEEGEP